jgi:hypothetical protein
MSPPIHPISSDPKVPAVKGECTGSGGFGVQGICDTGHGVHGQSRTSRGVVGTSDGYHGVYGKSTGNVGVAGESDKMSGVLGVSHDGSAAGVLGTNDKGGDGVVGNGRRGVVGTSVDYQGVYGFSGSNVGVIGESQSFEGVWGLAHDPTKAAIVGRNLAGGLAGLFDGSVTILGDLSLPNADCAEHFDIAGPCAVEPGSVMILGPDGGLVASDSAYDKRVAGVVSGAGLYKPGIVMDRQAAESRRQPISLLGKVCCMVDADFGAVEIGDLLTTSPTRGHAMKAGDPQRAFGAVIGKALQPLAAGRSLLPILIALQ